MYVCVCTPGYVWCPYLSMCVCVYSTSLSGSPMSWGGSSSGVTVPSMSTSVQQCEWKGNRRYWRASQKSGRLREHHRGRTPTCTQLHWKQKEWYTVPLQYVRTVWTDVTIVRSKCNTTHPPTFYIHISYFSSYPCNLSSPSLSHM